MVLQHNKFASLSLEALGSALHSALWLRATAGLAKDDKLGVRHNFCCRGPIFNPRPDMKTRRKTEGSNCGEISKK